MTWLPEVLLHDTQHNQVAILSLDQGRSGPALPPWTGDNPVTWLPAVLWDDKVRIRVSVPPPDATFFPSAGLGPRPYRSSDQGGTYTARQNNLEL